MQGQGTVLSEDGWMEQELHIYHPSNKSRALCTGPPTCESLEVAGSMLWDCLSVNGTDFRSKNVAMVQSWCHMDGISVSRSAGLPDHYEVIYSTLQIHHVWSYKLVVKSSYFSTLTSNISTIANFVYCFTISDSMHKHFVAISMMKSLFNSLIIPFFHQNLVNFPNKPKPMVGQSMEFLSVEAVLSFTFSSFWLLPCNWFRCGWFWKFCFCLVLRFPSCEVRLFSFACPYDRSRRRRLSERRNTGPRMTEASAVWRIAELPLVVELVRSVARSEELDPIGLSFE